MNSNVNGNGSRMMPLRLDYDVDREVDPTTSSVEFSIGYAPANELAPPLLNDGQYSLNSHVNTQSLACATLARMNSAEITALASPLDAEGDFTLGSLELAIDNTARLTLDLSNTVDGEVLITLERVGIVTTEYLLNPLTSL